MSQVVHNSTSESEGGNSIKQYGESNSEAAPNHRAGTVIMKKVTWTTMNANQAKVISTNPALNHQRDASGTRAQRTARKSNLSNLRLPLIGHHRTSINMTHQWIKKACWPQSKKLIQILCQNSSLQVSAMRTMNQAFQIWNNFS